MKRRSSVSRKNLRGLALFGLVLFLGIGVAVGFSFYRQNMNIYRNMAYSYVQMATSDIRGRMIERIVERGDEISSYYRKFKGAYTAGFQDVIDQLEEEIRRDPDLYELMSYWSDIDMSIFTNGNITSDIRFLYVVIPTEEDLIYIWDSDVEEKGGTDPLEHDAYSPGEKENLMKVMNGEWPEKLAIYREEHEILGSAMTPIYNPEREIVAVAVVDVSVSGIRHAFLRLLLNIGILILLILLVSGAIYYAIVQKRFIQPIITMEKATVQLVNDLQEGKEKPFQVNVRTGDELEILARSFEDMDSRLKAYIRENAEITAERERIGTELALARRIQEDMLPDNFTQFQDRGEFDIYASMRPAKEVGGDFYDFFLVDRDHLGLVIADVSGKGVPAALFMMMTKIMVQNFTMSGYSPKEVLENVNEQICSNNKEQMFITVWLGVLDLKTGILKAANAGHEYPILKQPQGAFELLKDSHSFVVGGMEGIRYKEYELQFVSGSKLFLYTDGLTEANNISEELFGTDRVLEALDEAAGQSVEEILDHVHDRVDAFVGKAPQFDDLTMMCLTYYGPAAAPAPEDRSENL